MRFTIRGKTELGGELGDATFTGKGELDQELRFGYLWPYMQSARPAPQAFECRASEQGSGGLDVKDRKGQVWEWG